jgi:hypothetical protein
MLYVLFFGNKILTILCGETITAKTKTKCHDMTCNATVVITVIDIKQDFFTESCPHLWWWLQEMFGGTYFSILSKALTSKHTAIPQIILLETSNIHNPK